VFVLTELIGVVYYKFMVNEYFLKISAGNIYIEKPLEIDQDLTATVIGQIVKQEDKTNNDGTVDRIYTLKAYLVEFTND
jgi:hypothetical protein